MLFSFVFLFLLISLSLISTLFPYTTLFRSLFKSLPRMLYLFSTLLMMYRMPASTPKGSSTVARSEEHTSELQSRGHFVCRLLLEKKKNMINLLKYYRIILKFESINHYI